MFQYAERRMSARSNRRRRRRMAATAPIADPSALGALVGAATPPAVFTTAEDVEIAEGHASQRTIEQDYNRSLSRRLRKLAHRAPTLERRKVRQLYEAYGRYDNEQRLRRAELANADMRDRGRHMPRWSRVLLCLLLAVVDVIAYRAAIEVAFDTSDEWPHVIDSYLLALLSIGMVMAAMFAAEQLKALHLASDRTPADARGGQSLAGARRVWRQTGVPALAAAVVLLVSGAALRVNVLGDVPAWFWLAVPAFSGAALVGAFFVEYKWADKALDERDDLSRKVRSATRRVHRADRRLAATEGDYRDRQADVIQLWSQYEPAWRVQLEMAAARIASARSEHPELFHPLGRSVVDSVHARIANGTTRRDGLTVVEALDLDVDQVLDRARATHAQRSAGQLAGHGPFPTDVLVATATPATPSTYAPPAAPAAAAHAAPVMASTSVPSNGPIPAGPSRTHWSAQPSTTPVTANPVPAHTNGHRPTRVETPSFR